MRGMTLAVVALLAAAMLAGCSGGDEEGLVPGAWVAWATGDPGEAAEGAIITLVHGGDEPAIELPEHGTYGRIALSPDGTRLAALYAPLGGEEEREPEDDTVLLRIFALPSGEEVAAIDAGSDRDTFLEDFQWSPDGTRLLTLYGNALVLRDRDGEPIGRREHSGRSTRVVALEWAPDSGRGLAFLEDGFILVARDARMIGPVPYDEIDDDRVQWSLKAWPTADALTLYSLAPPSGGDAGPTIEARAYTLTFDAEGLAGVAEPEMFDYVMYATEVDRKFRAELDAEYGKIRSGICRVCYKRGQGLIQRAFPYPQPTTTGSRYNPSIEWDPDTSIHVAVGTSDGLRTVIDLEYMPNDPRVWNFIRFDAVVVE